MTVPVIFASSFDYILSGAVLDVATIITTFRTRVLAQSPVWTEPSADRFKSPVDASGRFLEVLFTRVDQWTLQADVFDQLGATISQRRIFIDNPGPTPVDIYSGQFHFGISAQRAVTPEALGGGLLDHTPQGQTAWLNYVFGWGHRDNAGVVDGNGASSNFGSLDAGVATQATRGLVELVGGGATPLLDPLSFSVHKPISIRANMGGNQRIIGKLYQIYVVDPTFGFAVDIAIPVDTGVPATFRVLGRPTDVNGQVRLAMRKA